MSSSPEFKLTFRSLCFSAAGYAALGILGLQLALPPSYASPAFPAAGLALVLFLMLNNRLWPGIWLGSLAVEMYIPVASGSVTMASLLVALTMATGVVLQAWAGAWLIRRFLQERWRWLEDSGDILNFLVLGGPLSCLISASVGATALYLASIIVWVDLPMTWVTWWVGDILGVLIFAPLFLTFLSPQETFGKRRRVVIFTVALLLTAALAARYFGLAWIEQKQSLRLNEYLTQTLFPLAWWFLQEQGINLKWLGNVISLVIAGMLQMLALIITGRTSLIERKVAEQTRHILAQTQAFQHLSAEHDESKQLGHARIQMLSQALEQTAESIVITNPAAEIEYVNDAFLQSTGYSREELIGQHTRILNFGKTPAATYVSLWRTLTRGETWRGEFSNRRKDGSEYLEYATISPVRDEAGLTTHYVAAKVDITAQRLIEEELQQAKANAESANLAKSRFLATMSHELRTPMNGILGMAQVLMMADISESDRLDYTRTILSSGQTLLAQLNDILDLSKVEAGKIELEAIPVSPGQVVFDTHALFSETARSKGLVIEASWRGPTRSYLSDPHRLQQMLSNLVGNAIKFSVQGQIRIEAREVERQGEMAVLEFSVADTGIGIAEDNQDVLFQRFSQADSSITRSHGGSGLGLSIVSELAKLMGGGVGVESSLGQGSRFWFRISAACLAAKPQSGCVEPLAKATKLSGRVLVVEDILANRKVIAAMLGKLGLSFTMAEEGQQGVDAFISGEAVGLILMDIHMPVMDGYAATERIRHWEAENAGLRCPIVAMTADVFEDDRKRCLAAGMDDFVAKPLSFARLKKVLCRWLPVVEERIAAAPIFARRPADIPAIVLLLEEIRPLIAESKFAALGRFQALEEAVAGTEAAAEIAETGRILGDFHFVLAQEQLRRIAISHGWEATPHG